MVGNLHISRAVYSLPAYPHFIPALELLKAPLLSDIPTASLVLDLFIESSCIPFQLVFRKAGEAELFWCPPIGQDLGVLVFLSLNSDTGTPSRPSLRRNVSPAHTTQPPSVPVARWTNLPGHWLDWSVWKEMGLFGFFFPLKTGSSPPCKKHPNEKKTFELFFSSETIFTFFSAPANKS